MRRPTTLTVLLTMFAATSARSAKPEPTTGVAAGGERADAVDFRLAQRRFVVVPVLVNGKGPYDFLLDTGSTTSVVDHELAKELGLKPLQRTETRTAHGTERVLIARVHEMRVGPRSTETVLVLLSKMKGVRSLDDNIRGILGFNFLSRFRYTVDYQHAKLTFEERRVAGTRVPFDASDRAVVLTTDDGRFLLDTGASSVFIFRAEGMDLEINARTITKVTTNAGRRVSRSGWLNSLAIGGVSLHRVPVTLVSGSGPEPRAEGLLPGALFQSIYFDHEEDFVVLNPEPIGIETATRSSGR